MRTKTKFALFVIFIFVSLFVALYLGNSILNQSSIENFISIYPVSSALVYTLLFIVLGTFSFSTGVMITVGTLFFSGIATIFYATIGIMISSIIDFYVARTLGKDYVKNYISENGGKLEKFGEVIEHNPLKTIFVLNAIFFTPTALPNLLGGIIDIDLKDYFISTFLGNLPNTIFTVYLIQGLFYSNPYEIYISFAGLALTTIVGLYFYEGEIIDILKMSFKWFFK